MPAGDARAVTKALQTTVWPALEPHGFRAKGRAAWAETADTFSVVAFQSLNAHDALAIGCPTASFSVRLGVYYKAVDQLPWSPPRTAPPEEPACHARKTLPKGLDQRGKFRPFAGLGATRGPLRRGLEGLRRAFGPGPPERPDLWFVEPDGGNVAQVVADARRQLLDVGLPWRERFTDLETALAAFESDRDTGGHLAGAPGSVARAEVVTALALRLRRKTSAAAAWQAVLENPFYANDAAHRALAEERLRRFR